MVVRDNPVASATSEIPPRPRLWASAAAQRRRIRSSMIGDRAWNFAWIFATVVCVFIRTTYGQGNHCPVHFASAPKYNIVVSPLSIWVEGQHREAGGAHVRRGDSGRD